MRPQVRIARLKPGFYRSRRAHLALGSPEHVAVNYTIGQLMVEHHLPGPRDREQLRTPVSTTYARLIRGTNLVLLYALDPPFVDILAVKPAAW